MAARPTVRDVARLAGVSLGTASQALNYKTGVAAETRSRVLEAAQQLGYELRTPTASYIGMLTKRDTQANFPIDPFYSYVLSGVEHECQQQNMSLLYASVVADDNGPIQQLPPLLFDSHLAGLLLVGPFPEKAIEQIVGQTTTTIVLVDAYFHHGICDAIVNDNFNGAQTAVKHLIDQGHRHIGLVGSSPSAYFSVLERREAYLRTLQESGISNVYVEDSPLVREAVYEATIRLVSRAPQITALFACNDNVAIGAIKAVMDLGRSVPRDISIIGFDDIGAAQESHPPLTTVHVDKQLMGVLAVRQLLDRATDPEGTRLTTQLRTKLVIRDTVARI